MTEPATIFGAGPVGSLLALFLARRGHEVVVYERRPDLRGARAGAGRSINLAVSTRGLYALHQMGLDEKVLERAIPMLGRNLEHANVQHASIVRAILAGDPERARRAMEEHVAGTAALLRGFLGESA